MSLGEDIAGVIRENGIEIEVYHHDNNNTVSSEYLDYDRDVSSRVPFDSVNMMECTLPFNTSAKVGDRIDYVNTNEKYLLATTANEIFENEVISVQGVLYKCNSQIEVHRMSGEARNDDYKLIPNWNPIFSGEYVLFTGTLSEQDITDEKYARIYSTTRNMFASADLDLQQSDRCFVNGEAYSLDLIERDRLPGLQICRLSEDNRE